MSGAPIVAPAQQWTYQGFPDTYCGNGSTTGIAVNLHPSATTAVVFLQGGGACWDVATCYLLKVAVHVEDVVQEATVLAEAGSPSLALLFDRQDNANPVKDAHQVYVPYCTADLHSGTRVQRYEALGQVRDLHHEGALNLDAYLRRLVPTLAGVTRIILAGISAGGYGALANRWRFERAFGPSVRVDVLDDSGLPVTMAADRYAAAIAAWGPEWPAGCTDCAQRGFPRLLSDDARSGLRPHRTALLAYRSDLTIATYFGVSNSGIGPELDAERAAAAAHQRFFFVDGTGHVLMATPTLQTSNGKLVRDWVRELLADAITWSSVGP